MGDRDGPRWSGGPRRTPGNPPRPGFWDVLRESVPELFEEEAEVAARKQAAASRRRPLSSRPTGEPSVGDDDGEGERLQKVLARVGLGSRRVCEELIQARRVTVNGEVVGLGRRVDVEHDEVALDGVPIGVKPGLVYYLLNKPRGVVTTASDPQGRPTVVELVPAEPRVFPVGRLDADTEGLLLLTNDGSLTHRLTHPSFGVEKEYLAEVETTPTPGALRRLREGVELDDGVTAPAKASVAGPRTVRIVIHEGRNRQVRRMLGAVGHPVVRLVRMRVGPISDTRLRPGEWRELRADEVRSLAVAAQPNDPTLQRVRRSTSLRPAPERSPRAPG